MKEQQRQVIEALQKQIAGMESGRAGLSQGWLSLGLGEMETAFPGAAFPVGALHEFVSYSSEAAASTSGFLAMLLGRLMKRPGSCLWISTVPRRAVFPPALSGFKVLPERIVFVDAATPSQTLWALEEALKCEALSVVVGELSELGFNASRRLQLAAERSRVTALLHRYRPMRNNPVTCVSRWQITPLPSVAHQYLPGLGFPRWKADLLKVRNGQPGSWQIQWSPDGLLYLQPEQVADGHRKTG